MEFLILLLVNWVCAGAFVLVGFSCFKDRKPVGFWTGTQIHEDKVTDIKKYNFANGVMWCIYSALFWLAGFISIFNAKNCIIIDIFACTGGLAGLIIGYGWIKRRYFVSYRDRYVAGKLNDYK